MDTLFLVECPRVNLQPVFYLLSGKTRNNWLDRGVWEVRTGLGKSSGLQPGGTLKDFRERGAQSGLSGGSGGSFWLLEHTGRNLRAS